MLFKNGLPHKQRWMGWHPSVFKIPLRSCFPSSNNVSLLFWVKNDEISEHSLRMWGLKCGHDIWDDIWVGVDIVTILKCNNVSSCFFQSLVHGVVQSVIFFWNNMVGIVMSSDNFYRAIVRATSMTMCSMVTFSTACSSTESRHWEITSEAL